jgi:murein L,D-transpeptidase YcbB/YkuD
LTFSTRRTLRFATALFLLPLAVLSGCHRHRKTTSAPNTADYADNIHAAIGSPKLSILRWPNYSDYQKAVQTFYDDRDYELAWIRDLKPTPQANAFIQAFQQAEAKGLHPEDYDASRWPARVQQLEKIGASHDTANVS